jgi:NAD(P)H-hydrate epimerase
MKLCTAEQMRSIDQRAASEYGMPTLLLMENAGRAVADRALALLAERSGMTLDQLLAPGMARSYVQVLCGKGNNGGDGFVAARHLHNRGLRVGCFLAGNPDDVRGDARTNLELAAKLGIPIDPFEELDPDDLDADLIIDALLGTGFQGSPRGPAESAIRAMNEALRPVLAVDVLSGLDADTGDLKGWIISAVETVTFGLPKIGHARYPGRLFSGEVKVAAISLPAPLLEDPSIRTEWTDPRSALFRLPVRRLMAHKGESGRVFVLAGSPGMTGAAALCCDAALRAGAGLVTLGVPAGLSPILAVKLTEAMTLPLPETESGAHSPEALPRIREKLEGMGALAAGPGFGRDPKSGELLRALLADCPVPAVVDADGLFLLSPADERTFPANCVITPHPGEMARLLGTDVASVQSNSLEVVKSAAARFGCVTILKGPATLIAHPDGRLAVNSSGGPALATGGTGDVLTGIIAACLARGLEPYEAAVAGVYLHGVAGDVAEERFGAPGTVAGDVVAAIPEALRRLAAREIPPPCRIM